MFRIRFHGRGGQGMKTASRIVGTAAFRQGYYAQDSPVYGAERRGAPMVAFTRFDSRPIFERGMVAVPDLLVLADVSLIDDPLVRPLQGLAPNGCVLVNSTYSIDSVPSAAHDFTGLSMSLAGSASALSVALAAGAAKLAGLELRFLEEGVREELAPIFKNDPSRLEKNLDLARASFDKVERVMNPPASLRQPAAPEIRWVAPRYEGPWTGTASIASSPNTPLRKTGDWRVMRPEIDPERCTHCWVCFVNCPDGAISLGPSDLPQIDYGVCKGCLLCAEECPVDAISSEREGAANE